MGVERDIRELIRQIAGERQPVLFPAEVVSVQGTSCTVRYQGVMLSDVRLTAMDDSATITITRGGG